MSRILVAYSTNLGSTAEVAEVIAAELVRAGHAAEARPIPGITDLAGYDAVIVGAPMIFGWHHPARRFVSRHQAILSGMKVAYFACAMRLTRVSGGPVQPQVPLTLDPNLVSQPQKLGSLTFKERFTSIGHYLKPMLQAAPAVRPLSVAFFNGKLEMFRLKWWQAAFVMVVVQAAVGDYRDWDTIKAWAGSLAGQL